MAASKICTRRCFRASAWPGCRRRSLLRLASASRSSGDAAARLSRFFCGVMPISACAQSHYSRQRTRPGRTISTRAPASDNLAFDGCRGFCDAAAADAGKPHASHEAVRMRTALADEAVGLAPQQARCCYWSRSHDAHRSRRKLVGKLGPRQLDCCWPQLLIIQRVRMCRRDGFKVLPMFLVFHTPRRYAE